MTFLMNGFLQAYRFAFLLLLPAHWACSCTSFLETSIHRTTSCHTTSFTADNFRGATLDSA